MPEGDTIHRTAVALAAALQGREVTRFETFRLRTGRGPRAGERVERVRAQGKHLLIRFDGGLVLHTHMRMHGSWHLARRGERWRRSPDAAVAVIGTERIDAVCFSAPVVEVLGEHELARHPVLTALGPDLCLDDADLGEALRRLDTVDPATEVGVALLDQAIAAGVGNVYRSEVAWACRVDPFRPIGALDEAARLALFATAGRLLRANLGTPRRITVPGGLAVYDRAGRPCPRCGVAIATRRQGKHARSVWWCPGCQR